MLPKAIYMNLNIFVMCFDNNKTLLTLKIGLGTEQELRLDPPSKHKISVA
jgi:hypothetical protein